jgi:hypothetical protein
MILKLDQNANDIMLFDATISNGVALTRWSVFRMYAMDCFAHVFYRPLNCERDRFFLYSMEQFVSTVIGNKYKLSIKNILFKRTSILPPTKQASNRSVGSLSDAASS